MLDFYEKIKQVLSLEKDKGFQNSAVAGGLGNFLGYIQIRGSKIIFTAIFSPRYSITLNHMQFSQPMIEKNLSAYY